MPRSDRSGCARWPVKPRQINLNQAWRVPGFNKHPFATKSKQRQLSETRNIMAVIAVMRLMMRLAVRADLHIIFLVGMAVMVMLSVGHRHD